MKTRLQRQTFLNRILSIILIPVILGVTVTMGCSTPQTEEKFTEFYVLDLEGKAVDYPEELKVGEEDSVMMGIINREHEAASYQGEIKIDGVSNKQIELIELANDERWEETISFTPDRVGDNQKVEFLLYKNGQGEPYLKLHLWVNVKE